MEWLLWARYGHVCCLLCNMALHVCYMIIAEIKARNGHFGYLWDVFVVSLTIGTADVSIHKFRIRKCTKVDAVVER